MMKRGLCCTVGGTARTFRVQFPLGTPLWAGGGARAFLCPRGYRHPHKKTCYNPGLHNASPRPAPEVPDGGEKGTGCNKEFLPRAMLDRY